MPESTFAVTSSDDCRRIDDENEARRADFKSTVCLLLLLLFVVALALAWRLPTAAGVDGEEVNGCAWEERPRGRKALSEYFRVVRFDGFLWLEASSDVKSGV